MGLFRKAEPGGSAPAAPKPGAYSQFFAGAGGSQPSSGIESLASTYSQRAASTAALQVELESSKRAGRRAARQRRRRRRCCSLAGCCMHLLSALQIAAAVGLIVVVAVGLTAEEAAPVGEGQPPATVAVCLATTQGTNMCTYAYWAVGVSIAVSLAAAAVGACAPRRRSACCWSLETLLELAGTGWWTAAAIVTTVLGSEADEAGLGGHQWRLARWALCWAAAALFGAAALVSGVGCCTASCCDGEYDSDDDDNAVLA